MTNELEFIIENNIKGKGRPRFSRKNTDRVRAYTPKTTKQYEKMIQFYYLEATKNKKIKINSIKDKPFDLNIDCFFKIPKSYSKKKRLDCLQGTIAHTKRPDIDNILKVVLDALNKIAYNDDKQCVKASVNKCWSEENEYILIKLGWK